MKNVILSVVLLLLVVELFSQDNTVVPEPKLRFGINLGVNYSNLYSKSTLPVNTSISNGAGFRLGVTMDYAISKNLAVSPKAELSYNHSRVEFTNPDNSRAGYDVYPVSLEFMTHVLYKLGGGKIKPYLLAGPEIKLPLHKKSNSIEDYRTKTDFAIDLGFGFENKNRYFIFAPEIRYSLGLLNINQNPSIKNLNFHNISLLFNFK